MLFLLQDCSFDSLGISSVAVYFSHRACNLWNNLPVTIKNKPSLSLFKKALKNQPRVINTISFDGIVGTNKDIDVFIY